MRPLAVSIQLLTALFCLLQQPAFAADVSFLASVDRPRLGVGERLTLSFGLENAGMGGGDDLKYPDLKDFYLLSGPNQSSSVQFVNGSMSSSVTYTFVLQPKAAGRYSIGSASVEVDGKTYTTRPVEIEVIDGPAGQTPSPAPQRGGREGTREEIADNVFLKATVDRDHVVQGEQINLTYRIYTRLTVSDYAIHKAPTLSGFWGEDLPVPDNGNTTTEIIDGKEYRVGTIRRTALFPTQAGELEISRMEAQVVVEVRRSRRRDPFDSFFSEPFGGLFGRSVNYMLQSNPLKIEVDPLPEGAPASFKGAVGTLLMDASLDNRESRANEPITLTVSLAGTGNIKLLEAPELKLPPSLESYPPKATDKITGEGTALAGTKKFEYLIIPRSPGNIRIDPVEYSYFDPVKKKYITLKTEAMEIDVQSSGPEASTGGGARARSDVTLLNTDIRFIKLTDISLREKGKYFYHSPVFILLVLLPLFGLGVTIVYGKKIRRSRDNIALYREMRALSRAQKRLKCLQKEIGKTGADELCESISLAVWRYLGDRLGVDPGEYSVDRMGYLLLERGVPDENIQMLRRLLDRCAMENYAPGAAGGTAMGDLLRDGKEIVSQIERILS